MADVLQFELDADIVTSFFPFNETETPRSGGPKTRPAPLIPEGDGVGSPAQPDQIANVSGAGSSDRGHGPDLPDLPKGSAQALSALWAADSRAKADLADLVPWLTSEETALEEDHDHDHGDQIIQDAFAKPAWAGNGKGKDKTNGGGDSGSDGGTDTGGTDGGSGTGGTDTGGETNTGSTDPDVYVSGLDTPEGYNVELVFEGSWSTSQRDALAGAAERISDFVTGDLANHNGVDDIEITMRKAALDGGGGAWARGGPRSLRSDSALPSTGVVTFDTSDEGSLDGNGLWEDLGLHEMLHAMGFGTLFDRLGLTSTIDGQERFTGANAIEAYNTEFASKADSDPLSGKGVRLDPSGLHWHDGTFTKEIMTPYLRYSGNYVSDMTVAALEDMGYETTYNDMIDIA